MQKVISNYKKNGPARKTAGQHYEEKHGLGFKKHSAMLIANLDRTMRILFEQSLSDPKELPLIQHLI